MEGTGVKTNHEARQPQGQNDGQAWDSFNTGFFEVQKILEENKVLIGEINHNQESKIPENLTRNVALIKELNSNMTQVVGLYTSLSSSFVSFMEAESNGEVSTMEKGPLMAVGGVGQKRTSAT